MKLLSNEVSVHSRAPLRSSGHPLTSVEPGPEWRSPAGSGVLRGVNLNDLPPVPSDTALRRCRSQSSVDRYVIELAAEGAFGDSKKLFAVANIRSIVRAKRYAARAVPGQYLSAFAAAAVRESVATVVSYVRMVIWILTHTTLE